MTEPIRGALMHLSSALFFRARWALANVLLNTSAGFARLARRRPARSAYRRQARADKGPLRETGAAFSCVGSEGLKKI